MLDHVERGEIVDYETPPADPGVVAGLHSLGELVPMIVTSVITDPEDDTKIVSYSGWAFQPTAPTYVTVTDAPAPAPDVTQELTPDERGTLDKILALLQNAAANPAQPQTPVDPSSPTGTASEAPASPSPVESGSQPEPSPSDPTSPASGVSEGDGTTVDSGVNPVVPEPSPANNGGNTQ